MKRHSILICIILILGFCSTPQASILLDRVVAVVNQEVITWGDLYKAMEFEASDRMQGLSTEERRKIFKENEAVFLERLIDMKLQLQSAKQSGLDATAEDVSEAISDIKKKYSMDDSALTESLKKEGFTLDEYKKKIAEQIILSRAVSQHVRNKIVVSDSEVDKETAENKANMIDDDAYRIRQIFFKKPAGNITKENIEEKANTVLQQLKAGDDFSALAKVYSEDPSSKTGGDLGLIKKSYLAKEFTDVISRMKAGDFSPPFWTDKGLHIIKLEEKIEKQSDSELRESTRNKLLEKKFSDKYKSWLRGLRENAYIEIRL